MRKESNAIFNKEIKIVGKFEVTDEIRKICDKFFSSSHYSKDFKENELIAIFSKETGFLFLLNPVFVLVKFSNFDDLNIFQLLFNTQILKNRPEVLYLSISDSIKLGESSDEILRNSYYKAFDDNIFKKAGSLDINYSNSFEGIVVTLNTQTVNSKKEISYNFTFDFDDANKDVLFEIIEEIDVFYSTNQQKILEIIL